MSTTRDATGRVEPADPPPEHIAWVLDAALCSLDDRVSVLDREGRYVYLNRAAAERMGRSRDDLVGRKWDEVINRPADIVTWFGTNLAEVFATGRRVRSLHSVPLSAGVEDVEMILTPTFDEDGRSVRLVTATSLVRRGTETSPPQSTSGRSAPLQHDRRLSARQREVLTLVAEGHATQQIAAELSISPRTVEGHRRMIAEKLGSSHRSELFRYAREQGWI